MRRLGYLALFALVLGSAYAALRRESQVYTPEAVVDGQQPFLGSDDRTMASAIEQATARIAKGRSR